MTDHPREPNATRREQVKLTAHTDADVFNALQPRWNSLTTRSTANTPFNTWEWHKHWWAAYHPGELWIVACEDANGQLVGIAPWFIEDNAEQGRVVRFIGHVDVTDYMDFIIHTEHAEAVYSAYAQFLLDNRDHFDALGLANIPEDSPTYTAFPAALREAGFVVDFETNDVSPIIYLPPTYDDYMSDCLNSKERKEIKRKMRKAEGGMYDLGWYIVNGSHDLDAEMERFLHLMHTADTEKAEFLSNAQNVDFFKRVVPAAQNAGWLQLMFITLDGEACAAYLNFDYNNRIYVYNSGLDTNKGGALSPGIVLLQYAIQHAIEQERAVFDFLRGDEHYKYRMGGVDTHVYQLNATCCES